jgi:hypothetical protein
MKKSISVAFFLIMTVVMTVFLVSPVLSQDKPADNMQILRDNVKAYKKLVIAANMEHGNDRGRGEGFLACLRAVSEGPERDQLAHCQAHRQLR